MDYWKDVPGLEEALTIDNVISAIDKAIKQLENVEFAARKAGVNLPGPDLIKAAEGLKSKVQKMK